MCFPKFLKFTHLLTLPFLLAATANAGLLPVSVSPVKEGNHYRYTYGVVLTSDSELHTGDFFTIYDFAGLVANSNVQPANFSFSSDLSGSTPGRVNPDDNSHIPNLTFTYTGPNTALGQADLGNFSALSIYHTFDNGFFTARTHRQVDGHVDSNITDTLIPVPACPQVPEPATLILLAAGLPLAFAARHLLKNNRGTVAAS